MKIGSSLVSLSSLVEENYYFNIPIYQRLYVWGEDQVKTLLEDIQQAFLDGEEIFYLGGTLVVEKEKNSKYALYDLIDGQQRFTTLWMMAMVFRGALEQFIHGVKGDKKNIQRVTFAIREDVDEYFRSYIENKELPDTTPHIQDALAYIESFKAGLGKKSDEFANFIMNKVKLVFTEVPKSTDLNKLFEIINNRGMQLKHHEILKAQLLNKLNSEDRLKYSYLWDACSYMESYLEKNIRDISGIRVQDLFENADAKKGKENLAFAKQVLRAIKKSDTDQNRPLSLEKILRKKDLSEETENKKNMADDIEFEADEVQSIITFPMLLLHTLRIYLVDTDKKDISKILDKELLGIFGEYFNKKSLSEKEVKDFIELLWEIRYAFDKYIIKWVISDEGKTHLICSLYKSTNKQKGKVYYSLRRIKPDTNDGETLLQSMLYHSQQITTHYWLTPYLNYLLEHGSHKSYDYLKHLDNHLLCSDSDKPLVERTRLFLEDQWHEEDLNISALYEDSGTGFPHYWFYKLEFILWEIASKSNKDNRWKNFRMTAKNSVEHISPQLRRETDTNQVSKKMLNRFGNLALVSRSINSEYSNLPFNEKMQRFKNINRKKLDSYKMAKIYEENDSWGDSQAKAHQDEMIDCIKEYLGLD